VAFGDTDLDLNSPGPRRRIDASSKPWRWIESA
jgi:hypothetical protein